MSDFDFGNNKEKRKRGPKTQKKKAEDQDSAMIKTVSEIVNAMITSYQKNIPINLTKVIILSPIITKNRMLLE